MNTDNSELYNLIDQLKQASNKYTVTLAVSTSLVGAMRERIHENGIASDGSQIGTYSEGYMVVRTGQYKNSKTSKKGVTKAGTSKTGKPRPNYNRTNDTKVILSLTRDQERDWSVIEVNGQFGIGYKSDLNFNKSKWEEETYRKKIFDLTDKEQELVNETVNTYFTNVVS